MNRRTFLRLFAALPLVPRRLFAKPARNRVRPTDPLWPSRKAWQHLNEQVDGNLQPVDFPISACVSSPDGAACKNLIANINNPWYVGDTPGLTQTLGWIDAWTSRPSVYAVAAKSAGHVASAVNFARENNLRLVVKGGGHSYQGTSNAPDSLLIWTRAMRDVTLHDAFVPSGCHLAPQRAVTLGSGALWMHAYDAVTTRAGAYVQGGGCTTVGVAGLIQSGGFGSFSKYFGTAASSLLEAEVVTADGKVRIANACTHPDLFWALKGGGGGTFGAVSKLTLRVHDLPEFAGAAIFTVKASSDDAYRRLIRHFVAFYRDALFNPHWGEQAHFSPDNTLGLTLVQIGLDTEQTRRVWQPFLDWLALSPADYSIESKPIIGSMPSRHWWDVEWRAQRHLNVFKRDNRPGAPSTNVWWNGDGGQVAWVIWGFESLWLSAALLRDDSQEKLADALFSASRLSEVELHFNKGLAGANPQVIAAAKDTAMNPAVCDAFALAIVADGQGAAYPGVAGHEPDVTRGRAAAGRVHSCMNQLRAVAANGGAYVSESNFFESDYKQAYWGANAARLAAVKHRYDPDGLFFVHNGMGSEQWSPDGFTRL